VTDTFQPFPEAWPLKGIGAALKLTLTIAVLNQQSLILGHG
jgi:hypothetical protein